jgi:hypothetical protein
MLLVPATPSSNGHVLRSCTIVVPYPRPVACAIRYDHSGSTVSAVTHLVADLSYVCHRMSYVRLVRAGGGHGGGGAVCLVMDSTSRHTVPAVANVYVIQGVKLGVLGFLVFSGG